MILCLVPFRIAAVIPILTVGSWSRRICAWIIQNGTVTWAIWKLSDTPTTSLSLGELAFGGIDPHDDGKQRRQGQNGIKGNTLRPIPQFWLGISSCTGNRGAADSLTLNSRP